MKNQPKFSRREFATLAAASLTPTAPNPVLAWVQKQAPAKAPITADQSWRELLDGNARFVKGATTGPRRSPQDFRSLANAQYPEAVIVSCADSRVAPEILFDVGVGDIFVVRVAGNVVGGAGAVVKGSIEYAIAELNVPLIVVLGHSGCGAVKAAKQHIDAKDSLPGAINGLVELIKPAVTQSKRLPATRSKTPSARMSNSASSDSRICSRSSRPAPRREAHDRRRSLRFEHGRRHAPRCWKVLTELRLPAPAAIREAVPRSVPGCEPCRKAPQPWGATLGSLRASAQKRRRRLTLGSERRFPKVRSRTVPGLFA